MNTENSSRRFPALDLMKTIGILLVVYYHCRLVTNMSLYGHYTPRMLLYYTAMSFADICVPVFYFVNGYLLMSRPLVMKKHLLRTLHFGLLAVFWACVTVLINLRHEHIPITMRSVLHGMLLIPGEYTGHLWFMCALVAIYLLFPLIKCAWDNQRKLVYYLLILTLVVGFGYPLLSMIRNAGTWAITGVNPAVTVKWLSTFSPLKEFSAFAFAYFILGAICREHEEKIREKATVPLCIAVFLVSGLLNAAYGIFMNRSTVWDSVNQCYDSIFALTETLAVYGLAIRYQGKGIVGKAVRGIGGCTLGIYLIHYPFRQLLLDHFTHELSIESYFLKTLIFAAVLLAISLPATVLLKKIPLLKKLVS